MRFRKTLERRGHVLGYRAKGLRAVLRLGKTNPLLDGQCSIRILLHLDLSVDGKLLRVV